MNDNPIFQGVRRPSVDLQAVRQGLQTNLMTYTFSLATARSIAAGTALILPIGYTSIYVDAGSTGIATFHFQDQNPNAAGITAYPTSVWEVAGTQLCIENTAQAGASMTIIFGVDSAFRPSNAGGVNLLNPVNVIDAAAVRSLQGVAFIGKSTVTPSAPNLSCAQLWNPGGSGKNVIVENVTGNSSTATYELRFTIDTAAQASTAGATFNNKLASGAAGVAQLRLGNPAAQTGTEIFRDQALVNTRMTLVKSSSPIVLPPGYGLNVFTGAVNTQLYSDFEWYEQAQ